MKHCTTDKCPQILDSSCVFYEGASLIFSGINTNDSVETVIQKLNLKLESFPIFNLNNYYNKTETYSQTEINGFLSGKQNTIGYTPENSANKSDSYTISSSTTYASTKALVDGLATKLDKGINHTWSPTNRTLTLFDKDGNQLSQVSLVSLDNEGTDIRYNSSTLSLELYNADNELLDSIPVSSFIGSVGTQLQLNSNQLQLRDSQGNILSTVSFAVSNIGGLQTALDGKLDKGTYTGTAQSLKNDIETKQKKLSSFDESILIEPDGNIEGNVSLFTEYFNQQVCELNFSPIQIIGVYQDGIKLLPEEFNITLPKTITIKTYSTEKIEIQYTHLKNN